MDYKTLLLFALCIGKHNTIAAREAEEDSLRRRQEAKERAAVASKYSTNGNIAPTATVTTSELGSILSDNELAG